MNFIADISYFGGCFFVACCLGFISPFRSGNNVLPSWGLCIPSFTEQLSVLQTQRTKSSATSHGRTSVHNTVRGIRRWRLAHKSLQADGGGWYLTSLPYLDVPTPTRAFTQVVRRMPRLFYLLSAVKLQKMWCDPIQAAYKSDMECLVSRWQNSALRFVLAADLQLSLFLSQTGSR